MHLELWRNVQCDKEMFKELFNFPENEENDQFLRPMFLYYYDNFS